MLPNPLHPAVVHFPIVFVVVLPIVAIAAMVLIGRGLPTRPLWLAVVMLAGALTASSWLAVETGQEEEEVAEEVVARSPLHDHEEAAELFLVLSGVTLVLLASGLLNGRAGLVARYAGTTAAVLLLVAGAQVGHSGGELVYVHGAAQAYVDQPGSESRGERGESERRRRESDSDDEH